MKVVVFVTVTVTFVTLYPVPPKPVVSIIIPVESPCAAEIIVATFDALARETETMLPYLRVMSSILSFLFSYTNIASSSVDWTIPLPTILIVASPVESLSLMTLQLMPIC